MIASKNSTSAAATPMTAWPGPATGSGAVVTASTSGPPNRFASTTLIAPAPRPAAAPATAPPATAGLATAGLATAGLATAGLATAGPATAGPAVPPPAARRRHRGAPGRAGPGPGSS